MTAPSSPPLLIGCAAGFSGDRVDAAGPVVDTLIARGGPAFLIFETLAERTLALAQLRRRADPEAGYEPLLDDMLRPVLARCLQHGIRIVSNFGAANPHAAACHIQRMAGELGLAPPRIAVVGGDDVSGAPHRALLREQLGGAIDSIRMVSANAYIGAEAIAAALDAGAQIVVAGRVADPSLTVGPAMSHFGWRADDWDRLARATMAGHLLECGAQVCGGYFADPGYKEVPDLHALGYPIAEIDSDGHCVITKAAHTGGLVNLASVKEQLLYEVHDPAAYLTPDVVADISAAQIEQLGPDRVALRGVRGHARPASLKVNVCHEGGWLAEGEISYAGPRAEARARLAADVLRQRLQGLSLRVDLIGALSIMGGDDGRLLAATVAGDARDVRLRVAATHTERAQAERLAREVTALYCCGPAGGGGVRTSLTPRLNTLSCLVPRDAVPASFEMLGCEDSQRHPLTLRQAQDERKGEVKGGGTSSPAGAAEPALPGRRRSAPLGGSAVREATSVGAICVPLYRAAHGRTGDKGNRSNISVIAWHPDLYPVLLAQVTEAAVTRHFAHRRPSGVRRHGLPMLGAMNFVLDDVLDGGVNDALNLDTHGKALSFWLLDLPIQVPAALAVLLAGPDPG